jgi:prepilin-type N-terminal cleavage/methylation domain-containing protein
MNIKRKQGMSFIEIIVSLVIFAILIVFGTTIFSLISKNYNYYGYRIDQMADAQGTVEASYIGLEADTTTILASYSGIGAASKTITINEKDEYGNIINEIEVGGVIIPTDYATTGELLLFIAETED